MKLEVVAIPVSDVDRAAEFYGRLGWRLDADADARASGPDPKRRSYASFVTFSDPDGNGWLLQEITTRFPGRIDSDATTFGSASDLASALRRASAAHGEHEKRIGAADANWPDWYAAYMVREQAGTELPL
jgi:catechol 2,3-dioxygenase-like lactoylglutathione lyase family enzyme